MTLKDFTARSLTELMLVVGMEDNPNMFLGPICRLYGHPYRKLSRHTREVVVRKHEKSPQRYGTMNITHIHKRVISQTAAAFQGLTFLPNGGKQITLDRLRHIVAKIEPVNERSPSSVFELKKTAISPVHARSVSVHNYVKSAQDKGIRNAATKLPVHYGIFGNLFLQKQKCGKALQTCLALVAVFKNVMNYETFARLAHSWANVRAKMSQPLRKHLKKEFPNSVLAKDPVRRCKQPQVAGVVRTTWNTTPQPKNVTSYRIGSKTLTTKRHDGMTCLQPHQSEFLLLVLLRQIPFKVIIISCKNRVIAIQWLQLPQFRSSTAWEDEADSYAVETRCSEKSVVFPWVISLNKLVCHKNIYNDLVCDIKSEIIQAGFLESAEFVVDLKWGKLMTKYGSAKLEGYSSTAVNELHVRGLLNCNVPSVRYVVEEYSELFIGDEAPKFQKYRPSSDGAVGYLFSEIGERWFDQYPPGVALLYHLFMKMTLQSPGTPAVIKVGDRDMCEDLSYKCDNATALGAKCGCLAVRAWSQSLRPDAVIIVRSGNIYECVWTIATDCFSYVPTAGYFYAVLTSKITEVQQRVMYEPQLHLQPDAWELRGLHSIRRVAPTVPKRFVVPFISFCQVKGWPPLSFRHSELGTESNTVRHKQYSFWMPVLFCPLCHSLLMVEESANCYSLNCSTPCCSYQWFVTQPLVQEHKPRQDVRLRLEEDAVFSIDDQYSSSAQIEEKCPKCGHNRAYFVQMQTRSADEPSTTKYSCMKCRHIWTEN
ncbi:DNA-directed RNA polymerase III subunit RPC10 [Clonorchis sinensis]|uniref:DNA-directed RNA polymerase III subunit RPC10 n=3 Tax=Opisthorchiidae TaxID=6196 RepID=G7YUK2_CLOSI|nr:DNA-directed RNA polymerase III subunit RPC10 [Clonorchis sinensis]